MLYHRATRARADICCIGLSVREPPPTSERNASIPRQHEIASGTLVAALDASRHDGVGAFLSFCIPCKLAFPSHSRPIPVLNTTETPFPRAYH